MPFGPLFLDDYRRQLAAAADPRFVVDGPVRPAYADLEGAELRGRAAGAVAKLADCRLCPRACAVNRLRGERKTCGTGRRARVSSAFPHLGEEDCLRGWRGSGTIFFARCNLRCVFCQNCDISQGEAGEPVTAAELAGAMLQLQRAGCHNINFVSPSHVVPQLLEALVIAVDEGLRLPLVYNSGGYDSVETLRLLDGVVDIYMPDFKFWSGETARRLAAAPDYPDRARAALREMQRQVGALVFDADGVARRGVLVRHLVMPGQLDESESILRFLGEELAPETYVNVMGQYRPAHRVGERGAAGEPAFAEIQRRPNPEQLRAATAFARSRGLRLDRRHG